MKTLSFNPTKQLLVISSYPPSGTTHHKSVGGAASYTKNTLLHLAKNVFSKDSTPQITVLAEKMKGQKTDYSDENISVKRMWKKDSLLTFWDLLKEIWTNHKNTDTILIEFEFAVFCNTMAYLLPLPLFMLILKLMGKKVVFVFHQVILDLGELSGHINLKSGGLKTKILNTGIKLFYAIMLALSYRAIVFDEILRKRLATVGDVNKVAVIPLAVESFTEKVSSRKARQELGISRNTFVLMSFGFLSWYKGTDFLVDSFRKIPKEKKKDIMLILGGGESPSQIDKPHYQNYIARIKKVCLEEGITLTGFIPEEKMQLYFQACDMVLFPYRTIMSTSAPLSLAFSYKKPVLLSIHMKELLETQDIKDELIRSGMKKGQFLAHLNGDLNRKITFFKNNPKTLKSMGAFSARIAEKRAWNNLSENYYMELFDSGTKTTEYKPTIIERGNQYIIDYATKIKAGVPAFIKTHPLTNL